MTESDFYIGKGPDRIYKVGNVRFGRYGWRRWEANRNGRGSSGRTPWGAFLHLRRWEKVPLRPPPDDRTRR